VFWNGVEITSWSQETDVAQDYVTTVCGTSAHNIGRGWGGYYFDGYMEDFCLIDGQALTPSSFGQFDSTTGMWVQKDLSSLSSSKGTNGCYLNFENASTVAALGTDAFGGTAWSTSGFSVTAGKDLDSLIDNPKNNFCTLTPAVSTSLTLADGLLKATYNNPSAWSTALCGFEIPTTGKWYWEYNIALYKVRYNYCEGGEEKKGTPIDRVCETDFTVTKPYLAQKSSFGLTPKATTVNLDGYEDIFGDPIIGWTDLDKIMVLDANTYK
jgi:hypothetical protein